jgi:hypothetical protein
MIRNSRRLIIKIVEGNKDILCSPVSYFDGFGVNGGKSTFRISGTFTGAGGEDVRFVSCC